MRLSIEMLPNWESRTNHNGPFELRRLRATADNVLQISFGENTKRKELNFTIDQLADIAQKQALQSGGKIEVRVGGSCRFGTFGKVQFTTQRFPHCQTWVLCNNYDFITATYYCAALPSSDELAEVDYIVSRLGLKT